MERIGAGQSPRGSPIIAGVNILALDTATEACSAAVLREDGSLFEAFEVAPRQHMHLLPRMMERVLAAAQLEKSDLTHCAFTNGPGAFTGIRIAAAQAQGIGLALGIPLLPVSTLAALAQTAFDRFTGDNVLVALDARMQEIYWACYTRNPTGLARLVGGERLSSAADIVIDSGIDLGAGHGWIESLRESAEFPVEFSLLPGAGSLARLAAAAAAAGGAIEASRISINYLRNQVADKAAN